MRKISIILLFSAALPFAAMAQSEERTDNYPYWTISKDVQRIQYRDVVFVPAKITTGAWNVSKGVQQLAVNRAPKSTGQVSMTGYPSWTISKGVARMNYERSNKKSAN